MGKRGQAKKQAAIFCVLGLASLLGAFAVAWMGGHGYINVDPNIAVPVGLVLLIVFMVFGAFSLQADTSFIARKPWGSQPETIDSNICKRVVKSMEFNIEYLIHGPCASSLREVLLDDWPFEDVKPGSAWYVLDKRMNDVTDTPLSEIEGTVLLEVGM